MRTLIRAAVSFLAGLLTAFILYLAYVGLEDLIYTSTVTDAEVNQLCSGALTRDLRYYCYGTHRRSVPAD